MIRASCPVSRGTIEAQSLDELPQFPFCSERCRLIDLGRWLDSKYVIPGQEAAPPSESSSDDDRPSGE